jgi:SAM-dependent methyltransferase
MTKRALMCNTAIIQFGRSHLSQAEVMNKKVIEVGAQDINGSFRASIESLQPLSYLGVDVAHGKGVDEICDVNDLINRYGRESFDLVICTELMEHVRDWRNAVSNLKNILKPKGVILLTTRSKGYSYHAYPFDFWRYEVEDMTVLFSDLSIEIIERDPLMPGVFVKAHKPVAFSERNLATYDLYSIILGRRCGGISEFGILFSMPKFLFFKTKMTFRRLLSRILPACVKTIIKKVFFQGGRV